jgi:predicted ATPase
VSELPTGTVTFLFTDVEGSTRLLQELGNDYASVLTEHRRVLRQAFARHGGVEVDTQGDAFFVAFAKATDALAAAREAQDALADGPVRVRMGLHTGEPVLAGDGYVGMDVHRAARIAAAGHGGQILVSQPTRDLVGADGVRDLGEHRLKDLAAPERLFQLGTTQFPPLKTLSNSNLPVPAEALLGRKKELADALRSIRGGTRLLTITGPGGIGKTRFALEVAAELIDDFTDGVWWVGLAPVRDPNLVLPTIAAAVGAKGELESELRSKQLLLLLDNLEQVVDVAPALADLQRLCADLVLLVTSREPLRIAGEREYPLRALAEAPAVELLRQRARAINPDFDAAYHELAAVCDRLDRLPLAIELAAARAKVLSAGSLLERLQERLPLLTSRRRDLDARQQTLRATIDWSYDLLGADEKDLFERLSAFAGSFDLGAAEEVAVADIDVLTSLVDKSLVRQTEEGRFFMLETIREYAAERLRASPDADDIRRRHAGHFLRLARESKPRIRTPEIAAVVEQLARDEGNFRAALTWMIESGDLESALSLGAELCTFWLTRNYIADARRWRAEVLPQRSAVPAELRAAAARAGGLLAFQFDSDHAEAELLFDECLAVYRELGMLEEIASVTAFAGGVAQSRGDLQEALRYRAEGLALQRAIGNTRGEVNALHLLGETYRDLGDFGRGQETLEQAVRLARQTGDIQAVGYSLHSLGDLHLDLGDLEHARERYLESLDLVAEFGDRRGAAYCVAGLASVLAAEGKTEVAATLWGAVERLEEILESPIHAMERPRYERRLATLTGSEAWERGRALSLEEALEHAHAASID